MQIDITSTANPRIKWLTNLHKSSSRKHEQLTIVEGAKEITYAIQAGLRPHSLFVAPEVIGKSQATPSITPQYNISSKCFEKVTYRSGSDGIIAVFHTPDTSLSKLSLDKLPFVIVIESIEKPGNLGAIIRTADATGADAVIICDEKTDIWNPNSIRASVGTIFTTPVVSASNEAVAEWLKQHNITPFAAAISSDSLPYTSKNYEKPTAIICGSEANGLSDFWLSRSEKVTIPMLGKNDSLNVSVATGVLAYEVVRQRQR